MSDDVKEDPLLESILAILVLDEVFEVSGNLNAYVLNRENEVAFDMIVFLINNPPYLAAREMIRYFPKMKGPARMITDGG